MKPLALAVLLALGAPTVAAEPTRFYGDRPVDFALRFSQHTVDLDYGDAVVDTSVDRAGIAWSERYGERLQLGLHIDYAVLTQHDRPETAGRELTGYHAGLSLDLELLRLGRGALFLAGNLGYHRVDDGEDDGEQRVVIRWTEPSASLGVGAPIVGGLRAYGGLRYGRLDGEQRLSGTVNETREIQEDERSGGFVGLELSLERDGYIGAVAESGVDRSVRIYFGQVF